MDPGARMTPTLRSSYYHQWSLLQGGFEIPFYLEVHRSSITSSKKLLEWYTKVVEALHIKNPSWWQLHWFFDSNTRDYWFSDSCYFWSNKDEFKETAKFKRKFDCCKITSSFKKGYKDWLEQSLMYIYFIINHFSHLKQKKTIFLRKAELKIANVTAVEENLESNIAKHSHDLKLTITKLTQI